jgi:hypothetical protein
VLVVDLKMPRAVGVAVLKEIAPRFLVDGIREVHAGSMVRPARLG